MRIIVVDDEPREQQKLIKLLKEICEERYINVELIGTYDNGENFLREWKSGCCDLIILDIMMGKMTGIDVALQIRKRDKNVRIIFCSNTNQYAGESYLVEASYYLQKPVEKVHIEKMIKRLKLENIELYQSILLPNGKKIPVRAISYIEIVQHRAVVHQIDKEVIYVWSTQKELEKELQMANCFVRIRNGILINLYEVASIEKDVVTMKEGSILYIAGNKMKQIEELYADFLFRQVRKAECC